METSDTIDENDPIIQINDGFVDGAAEKLPLGALVSYGRLTSEQLRTLIESLNQNS